MLQPCALLTTSKQQKQQKKSRHILLSAILVLKMFLFPAFFLNLFFPSCFRVLPKNTKSSSDLLAGTQRQHFLPSVASRHVPFILPARWRSHSRIERCALPTPRMRERCTTPTFLLAPVDHAVQARRRFPHHAAFVSSDRKSALGRSLQERWIVEAFGAAGWC